MTGWINMPLGTEVRLGPSDIIVRWGPSSPSQKQTEPPFSAYVCCGQTAGWIKMTIGMVVGLIVLDFGASSLSRKKGTVVPPKVMFIVAKWPDASGDIVR